VERQFNARYKAWEKYISYPSIEILSTSTSRTDNPFFDAIVELGPPALPFIVAKIEKDSPPRWLSAAVTRITKVRFERIYNKVTNKVTFPEYPDRKPDEEVVIYWWKMGRFKTGERFVERYVEWCRLTAEKKTAEAEAAYQRIVNLGLPVLPYLAEAAEKEPDLVRAISKLTDGALPPDTKPSECRQLWKKHKARFELPPLRSGEKWHPKTGHPPK
jgi:hypothetical protein